MDTETVKTLILETLIDVEYVKLLGSTIAMDKINLSEEYKKTLESIDRVASQQI